VAHRRNVPDEDTESKRICDNDQMCMLQTQESDEDEDYDEKEQPSAQQGNANTLGSGDCGLRLTRHTSISLQVVTEERSRKKHHKYIRNRHLACNLEKHIMKTSIANCSLSKGTGYSSE
jgi:hypothetical protein